MSKPSGWNRHTDGKTTTQRGYGYKWVKIRERILERDNYICVKCLERHIITAARDVDHIIEKANGGTDDENNLQSLCAACHKDKTNKKQTAPCNKDGMPTNPKHYWNR